MTCRIVIGTYTLGDVPSVVPSNPFGATPMIVIVWPLMMIFSLTMFGFAPSFVCQKS